MLTASMQSEVDALLGENAPTELRDRFAISPLLDVEIDVGAAGWVGLTADADHDLRLDVTSAVIARFLGSSVSTAKKYVKGLKEHSPRDQTVRGLCQRHMSEYDHFYRTIEVRTDAPIGVFAFDLAMVRSRASIELMLVTARQGFLIEPCLIGRSVMEQFAYAIRVWETDDDSLIFSSKPQSLIRYLHEIQPSAGRAYGMLSRLAHYDPKMHYSLIGASETNGIGGNSSTVLQRSWKFKITSLAWLFYILDLKYKIFRACYATYPNFGCLRALDDSIVDEFDRFFEGVDFPAVRQVRALFT